MKQYYPSKIEEKWQRKWEKCPPYRIGTGKAKNKFYGLVEFPYPSGSGLHLGHAFTFTIMDVLARKRRMQGKNTLYPMGWDAFGLPTENYAIKTGIHPAAATKKNVARFKKQMKRLGLAYNWEREVNTTDPAYYHWTQWIFLQLFKRGLAYKQKMPINWCPSCKIGLANEEVVNGRCERCGAEAGQKEMSQWLLRITAYADRLADELDLVDYPDHVKAAQRHWIGRKEWIDISYPVEGTKKKIVCSTTRPDTNFGATFIVLAPEHPTVDLVSVNLKGCLGSSHSSEVGRQKEIRAYVEQAKTKTEAERMAEGREKTGVFTGLYAINQLNGRRLPIYIADFVLTSVGTGAVVGVPGHDQRDFEFAKQFKLPVIQVIEKGRMINSEFLNGLDIHQATKKMMDYIEKKGWGKRVIRYHLRDWIFSRQHYWGEPIPMVYCPKCAQKGPGWIPLPESDLPLKLPEVEKYQPTSTGKSPLADVKDWVNTKCPHCGGPAQRETDTMPNWAGSSWYYLAYCFDQLDYWLPVDIYLGGAEHTTLHLLYSRFWHKFLNDIGVAPGKEPYAARRQHGNILAEDGSRMSKSRGNVVDPETIVKKYGADTLRLYLLFMGPYEQTMSWNSKGIEGCHRFLKKVWQIYQAASQGKTSDGCPPMRRESSEVGELASARRALHRLVKKVSEDIDQLKYNTAIAAMMSYVKKFSIEDKETFLKLLAPFAPFIAEELWEHPSSIHLQKWPEYQAKLVGERVNTIIVQIDGKMREKLKIKNKKQKTKKEIEKLARASQKVQKYLENKKVKKVIFLTNRLINFVTS